jgi:glycosyltransferase involved in cell wall biosynthesis
MSKFNLYCPINNMGYGIVSKAIITTLLSKQFNDFHLAPIGQIQLDSQLEVPMINAQLQVPWTRSAPSVAIWHEFDLNKFSSNKLLAFPFFETTGFTAGSLNYLNQMDGILVLSSWAKKVVEDNLLNKIPVHVIQGASNFLDNEAVRSVPKNNVFTFVNVGKLEKRKGHLELISAYIDVFKDRKADTRLICHCFSSFEQNFVNTMHQILNSLGLRVYGSSTIKDSIIGVNGNAIVEIPRGPVAKQEVFQLYKFCHMGVFPSKAEGWNLPLMEAIKTGTPCIASNYSAHTEYLTEEYGYPQDLLLNKYSMERAADGKFFNGDRGDWAVMDMAELKEKMLYSYENYEQVSKNFDNTKIKEHFTWDNTVNQLLNVIELYS